MNYVILLYYILDLEWANEFCTLQLKKGFKKFVAQYNVDKVSKDKLLSWL